MKNARKGKARILDIGMDPQKGYVGALTKAEFQRLVKFGFKRRWTGEFVRVNGVLTRLYEWVPK